MRWKAVAAFAAAALLAGCGARAEREALRGCEFAPRGIETSSSGDSMTFSVKIEIRNPGKKAAVLDSFSAIATGGRPLARLSHGSLVRVAPGATDTALLHVRIPSQGLLAAGLALAFAPPDSVSLDGTAWIPGFFGGVSAHPIRMSVPWSRIAPQVRSFVPSP